MWHCGNMTSIIHVSVSGFSFVAYVHIFFNSYVLSEIRFLALTLSHHLVPSIVVNYTIKYVSFPPDQFFEYPILLFGLSCIDIHLYT